MYFNNKADNNDPKVIAENVVKRLLEDAEKRKEEKSKETGFNRNSFEYEKSKSEMTLKPQIHEV